LALFLTIKKEVNMTHNISKLFDQLLDAWNRHDAKSAASFYDENIVWRDYSIPQPFKGIEGATKIFEMWEKAFPDFKIRVINKIVGEDMVAFQMEFTGTHTGPIEFPGMVIPATNKKITGTDANFLKFRNGKLYEVHDYPDVQGMMAQLGLETVQEQTTF
jgi:steroid delta-isomerase-like uncharacterized protein